MRNAGGKHVIKGRNAIGRNKKQMIAAEKVHIADLATGKQFKIGEVGL